MPDTMREHMCRPGRCERRTKAARPRPPPRVASCASIPGYANSHAGDPLSSGSRLHFVQEIHEINGLTIPRLQDCLHDIVPQLQRALAIETQAFKQKTDDIRRPALA